VSENERPRKKFVVGLGNPGRRYAKTRHNVGFRVLDRLRQRWQGGRDRRAFSGRLSEARPGRAGLSEPKVLLLAPRTYMNQSGQAVGAMVRYYKADLGDVLVVLDDTALPLGQIRGRASGSAGGHNGLEDVLAAVGSNDLPRLRIGIGPPAPGQDLVQYVLAPFTSEEEQTIEQAVDTAAQAVEDWVFHGMGYVMNTYNRKDPDAS